MKMALGFAFLVALTGCKSADKKAEEKRQAEKSAIASALLVAQQGLRGEVPDKFLEDALQTYAETIEGNKKVAVLDMQAAFKAHDTTRVRYDMRVLSRK